MSRSSAAAFDHAAANDSSTANATASTEQQSWSEDKNPTRPLPPLRLKEEARRLDRAAVTAAMRGDDNATEPANTDDEPTLDAPAPSSPGATSAMYSPCPVRVTARPPALKVLVITRPPPKRLPRASVAPAAVISRLPTEPLAFPRSAPSLVMSMSEPAPATTPAALAPQSGSHRITPGRSRTALDLRDAEDPRRSEETFKIPLPKRNVQAFVVAGIWALALSLIAILMFMAASA